MTYTNQFHRKGGLDLKELTSQDIQEKLDIHEIVADIMIERGLDTEKKLDTYLNDSFEDLPNPSKIPNIKEVIQKIKEHAYFSSIIIYSDYDVDGITSAYLMHTALKRLAKNSDVEIFISNRFRDGYGLSKKAVDIIDNKNGELIITLDCGISNHESIEYAKSKGMDVVVIDHHESEKEPNVPYVDLKVKQGNYPFRELCSAGVTWNICHHMLDDGYKNMLDIVAVGTVADVVPLVKQNRILVKEGISQIREGRVNRGLQAIMDVNDVDHEKLTAEDIGYQIGPLINATGRLGSAYPALSLLMEDDPKERGFLAHELEQTNNQRKHVTKKVFNKLKDKINENNNVIVCESKAHQGIVGLVAGRISNKYNKPAIVVDKMSRKGSARSVKPFNIYHNLKKCVNEGLLDSAGGHSMAAGVSVSRKNFKPFKIKMNQLASDIGFIDTDYDKEIQLTQVSDKLLNDLQILQPFGEGNEKPRFLSKDVSPSFVRLTKSGEHVMLRIDSLSGIAFRKSEYEQSLRNGNVDIIYTLAWNEWNGKKEKQMIVDNINPFN